MRSFIAALAVAALTLVAGAAGASGATGPVKHYAALSGDDFVQMPHGIKDRLVLEASRDCTFKAYDPLTLKAVFDGSVKAGERVTLPGTLASQHAPEIRPFP